MEAPRKRSSERGESVGAGLLSRGGSGFGYFAGFAGALNAGGFAAQIAEEVEACAADMALAGDFNGGDGRRMEREDALNAGAKADAADREGGARSAAFLGNDHAFKGLDAFLDLFAFAFEEADVDADGVTRAKLRQIFAQLHFMKFANHRIHFRIPRRPTQAGPALLRQSQIIRENAQIY